VSQTNGFARGGLDGPPQQWRLALRRLPVTLAVLVVVASTAAGLAYVASGSGVHGFRAILVNDLGETVLYGGCDETDCKKGGALSPQQLAAGERDTVQLHVGGDGNPILVLTPDGKRVGCLFLRYKKAPAVEPVIRLSKAIGC
jgi:hypothetical protein